MAAVAEPIVQRHGDAFYATWASQDLVLEFSRLTDHRDTLSAELSVVSTRKGPMHWSRVNLASASGRHAVIKTLEEMDPTITWRTILDRSCRSVAGEYRKPEPAVFLVPRAPSPESWLIDKVVPLRHTTVLFGDGGAGKSLVALALALAGLQGYALGPWLVRDLRRVLILDWESDAETHEERLWGLTSPREALDPERIVHRRLRAPLVQELPTIRADVARYEPDLTLVDSLGAASGAEPETADAAVTTLMALASLPTTRLVIAHVSKASAEAKQSKPFGSVYVHNLARSTIEARRSDDLDDQTELSVTLYHRKSNYGPRVKPIGLRFAFDQVGHIHLHSERPDLASAGLPSAIIDVLRRGPASGTSGTDIAEIVDAVPASVRRTLNRMEKRDIVRRVVPLNGGQGVKTLWLLNDTKRDT